MGQHIHCQGLFIGEPDSYLACFTPNGSLNGKKGIRLHWHLCEAES
ncbi:Uncharacterised protein [Serratia fonticola]|nr:Uncharacterised protein [Serratia fonticola]